MNKRGVLLAALATIAMGGAAGCAQEAAMGGIGNALPPSAQPSLLAERSSLAPEAMETAAVVSSCTPGSLATVTPGALTVSTAVTPDPPWFNDRDPSTGDGLESSIVRDVAGVLGYRDATWVPPGSPSDIYVGQFTSKEPTVINGVQEVSNGYFAVNDILVRRKGHTLPPEKSRLGYVEGAQSEKTVEDRRATEKLPFATEREGISALLSGAVDGMLIPVTSAIDMDATQLARFAPLVQVKPDAKSQPDQLKFLLPANSPLTPCVDAAIDRLRVEGILKSRADQWVPIPMEGGAR